MVRLIHVGFSFIGGQPHMVVDIKGNTKAEVNIRLFIDKNHLWLKVQDEEGQVAGMPIPLADSILLWLMKAAEARQVSATLRRHGEGVETHTQCVEVDECLVNALRERASKTHPYKR